MPLLFVFVVYVPTYARYWPFGATLFSAGADDSNRSGAHNTSRNANTLLVIFMKIGILLLFFFVFFLQDGGGGDGIVFFKPQQTHALRGAARLANFVGMHADDFPVVRDDHHVGLFSHLQRGDDVTVAVRSLHVDHAFAAT